MITKGQVWIETVIYTLIGLTLIGVVLGLITPRINEYRDETLVEQSIDSLQILDQKIQEVINEGPGNVRVVEFAMQRGVLIIDPTDNTITFILDDSRTLYSEPDIPIEIGNVEIVTIEGAQEHTVELTLPYAQHNLIVQGADTLPKQYSAASIPYRFSITHAGLNAGEVQLEINEIS